jgi:hypothetical protein
MAFVKEKREIYLNNGINHIEYTNVTSNIDPTSVLLEDPTNNKTTVLEQQYEYDLVSSSNLLDKYMEKRINATDSNGKNYTGKLLSHEQNKVILKRDDGSIVSLNDIKVEFPDSFGLHTKPTLVWQIYSPTSGKQDLIISYLTRGLSWSANYILQTNANSTKADIRSWVNINNKAGISFNDAKLKLMAGDIHGVYGSGSVYRHRDMVPVKSFTSAKGISETPLFEYHLYTLEKPVTLINNQAKQISLLSVDSIPVQKELIFDSSKDDKVQIVLKIDNSKADGLGIPLPSGTVKVYQHDSEEQLQFIGEDQIDHTPIGKKIKVTVGNAFDIIGERTLTDFEQVNNNISRTSYQIVLNNNKSGAQNVTVVEHFYGNWKIIKNFDKYEKIDAFTVEFRVSVPANGTKTIFYTVKNNVGAPVETIGKTVIENSTIENTTTENLIIGSTKAEN